MKEPVVSSILLIIIILWGNISTGQSLAPGSIRLKRITILSSNLDSLTRSYLKQGFRIKPGIRDPGGMFNNIILFSDGSEIIIESPTCSDSNDWHNKSLKKFGNHIAGLGFEVNSIDSLYSILRITHVPLSPLDSFTLENSGGSNYKAKGFALDSCAPLDIVFYSGDTSKIFRSAEDDSLTAHPNHNFRFDWVLLSAGSIAEAWMRKILAASGALKLHTGCCDYWRLGPSDDFCFFRFDPPTKKAKGKPNWLSVEPDAFYFAY